MDQKVKKSNAKKSNGKQVQGENTPGFENIKKSISNYDASISIIEQEFQAELDTSDRVAIENAKDNDQNRVDAEDEDLVFD
jgi:hypothetical protein